MAIIKTFYSDSNLSLQNMGNGNPPWLNNYDDKNSWYLGDNTSYYFYNLTEDHAFIQYGHNNSLWATTRFWGEQVIVNSQNELSDGSIDVNVTCIPIFFIGRKTDFALSSGYQVWYNIYMNGNVVFEFNGQSIDELTQYNNTPINFTVNVKPQEYITQTSFVINIHYPNGEVPDSTTTIGFSLFNDNPIDTTYIPMAIRKSNTWKDFNSNDGYILIRNSDLFINKSKEQNSTSGQADSGHNRIRKSGIWRQLPKMNGGTT